MKDYRSPGYHTISQYQHIHTRAQITFQGLFRGIYNRLVFIKRSIEQNRYPAFFIKGVDQVVITRIGGSRNRFSYGGITLIGWRH